MDKTMDALCKEQGRFSDLYRPHTKKEGNMTGQGIDFINFIIDALDDKPLMKEALEKETPKKLYEFFQANGYTDVPFKDCAGLVIASKAARGRGVTEQGDPVDVEEAERPPGY